MSIMIILVNIDLKKDQILAFLNLYYEYAVEISAFNLKLILNLKFYYVIIVIFYSLYTKFSRKKKTIT